MQIAESLEQFYGNYDWAEATNLTDSLIYRSILQIYLRVVIKSENFIKMDLETTHQHGTFHTTYNKPQFT